MTSDAGDLEKIMEALERGIESDDPIVLRPSPAAAEIDAGAATARPKKPRKSSGGRFKPKNTFCAPEQNLLNEESSRAAAAEAASLIETPRLTAAECTTATIDCNAAGVQFSCASLMPHLTPDSRIRTIHSNVGAHYYSDAERKRHEKEMKSKEQSRIRSHLKHLRALGAPIPAMTEVAAKVAKRGKDFNSQITFETTSLSVRKRGELQRYKFKIFHTGVIQLPGSVPNHIDDVMESLRYLLEHFRRGLAAKAEADGLAEPAPLKLEYVRYVLKNYKLAVKLERKQYLDLYSLYQLCYDGAGAEAWNEAHGEGETAPSVVSCEYQSSPYKLTILFAAPTPLRPDKLIMFKIFTSGKITILGALMIEDTRRCIEFVDGLLKKYWRDIILRRWKAEAALDDRPDEGGAAKTPKSAKKTPAAKKSGEPRERR